MVKLEKGGRLLSPGWISWCKDPVLILAITLVFSLDQITKAVIRDNLLLGESFPRDGVVRITHTFNTGSAFGLFPDQTLFLILASFVGIGILLLVYRHHPFPSFPLRLGLGMQLGGAIGNLLDRVRMGHVTDFIDLGFWPVFNLADASIVLGIIILAHLFLFVRREEKPSPGVGAPPSGAGAHSADHQSYDWSEHKSTFIPGDDHIGEDLPCPICDSSMLEVPDGWRCSGCGVKERVEKRGPA